MKWTSDTSGLPTYLRITASGDVTLESYVAMWSEILAGDVWRPGMSVIIDGRGFFPVAPEQLKGMTTDLANFFAERTAELGPSHIARLVNSDNFQSARRFQYALITRDLPMTFQIFANESDAVLWLEYFQKQPATT